VSTAASSYLDRAERVFRIAELVGQVEHLRQLLDVAEDYVGMAERAEPDEGERQRIAQLRRLIAEWRPGG
jgi:hypothetical protein